MTFRATVRDGLIVVNTHGAIADGTTVEISVPVDQGAKRGGAGRGRGAKKTKKKAARRGRVPGYGMWADWTELGSSEEAVDRLRALTRRRRVG